MGKLRKWKLFIPIIFFVALLVISASGCASNSTINSSDQAIKVSPQSTPIAIPFDKIAGRLLETSDFPVFLPAYLPAPYTGEEWFLNLESSNNKFTIEIDLRSRGNKTGMYVGTLSGNVGNPPVSPLEKQFISENRELKTIKLTNEIECKEYIIDPAAGKAISWESGQWGYFVAAQPDSKEGSTISYASQIINLIGGNGLALSEFPGRLYFFYTGANHPTTEIFWKVNNSVWYQLDWRDDPSNAIKILRSMKQIGINEQTK
ncbi:hypothetical protein [Desulfosporosinus metallidurans]|uniref:Uncharacterized protein n=1 Tax=Desulfosporosinus metallidurans TaxID=1888891 RepID=A0A1Q8QZR0_9FIRM|nr:hypothetical protein [Desulfosporosinus metallidurans]OLN32852.1 hypothetical protein DSOL_1298 [Desulfosporosinus metallidurans]